MWKHLLKKTLRKLGISIDRREKESYPQFLSFLFKGLPHQHKL